MKAFIPLLFLVAAASASDLDANGCPAGVVDSDGNAVVYSLGADGNCYREKGWYKFVSKDADFFFPFFSCGKTFDVILPI